MTGRIVREIRVQSSPNEIGMTGWMLAVYFIAWAGPMPKSQLFWIGTLTRLATGLSVCLTSSASLAAAAAAASAVALESSPGVGASEDELFVLCAETLTAMMETIATMYMARLRL